MKNSIKKGNLNPLRKGDKKAREIGRKGGRARSPRKTMAVRMNSRKYCDSRCPIYRDCPYMFESRKSEGKKETCGLKKTSPETQRRVWDILRKGNPELVMEMRRVLVKMGGLVETSDSVKELAIYNEQLKGLHETLHGKKTKTEISGELKTGLSIADFKKAMKELKE